MKRIFPLIFLAAVMTACDVYVVEPRYDTRDELIGAYDVEEYSETYNDITFYTFRVSKSYYASDEIYIDNFYASDISVRAYVSYDKITIPYQVVSGFEIEGVGTIYGRKLNFSYRVKDLYNHSPSDFCETKAWLDW